MIALQKVALQLLSDFSLQAKELELAGSISKWELEIEMLLRNPGFYKLQHTMSPKDKYPSEFFCSCSHKVGQSQILIEHKQTINHFCILHNEKNQESNT